MNTLICPANQRSESFALTGASCGMCDLGRGEIGCICALEADPSEARRLAEMGLVHGAVVRMIKPGRACIVGLNCSRLSLGSTLQRNVKVTRLTLRESESIVA